MDDVPSRITASTGMISPGFTTSSSCSLTSSIGISSIPNDIPILSQNMNIDFPFMILLLLTLILPTIKNNKLYRLQGLTMLIIYFIYIGTLYTMYI